ncbi:hypothetical protein CR938_03180 [Pseudoxanthomonas taiwanensis]|uniref:Uncharacterized protein n=2 Tax=Pseudoxanthomonas taiwanensis TaxID=176598 RepID=A0A921P287_9GAMM|nr:hypothetical protein CR938_03180 [Pseudoxanthomonas taiwanensis]
MLFDACLTAGVDPEVAFEHLDDMDVAEYGRALREGWFPVGHLPLFMRSLSEAIAAGRCLCPRCRTRKS